MEGLFPAVKKENPELSCFKTSCQSIVWRSKIEVFCQETRPKQRCLEVGTQMKREFHPMNASLEFRSRNFVGQGQDSWTMQALATSLLKIERNNFVSLLVLEMEIEYRASRSGISSLSENRKRGGFELAENRGEVENSRRFRETIL